MELIVDVVLRVCGLIGFHQKLVFQLGKERQLLRSSIFMLLGCLSAAVLYHRPLNFSV